MAHITGTSGDDLIHMNGDGQTAGSGVTDINTVTTGDDIIDAGNGNDRIYADLGNDSVLGGKGNDYAFGDEGNDTLDGGAGADTLVGDQGTDKLTGDAGNDLFLIDQVSDISGLAETIDGGSDTDTLDFASQGASGAIDLSLATIVNMENLVLAGDDVTLTAAQLGEFSKIQGSFGVEHLILSGAGTVDLTGAVISLIDEIRGSSGKDKLILTGVSEGQTFNGLDGDDQAIGGDGGDHFDGGDRNDSLSGAGGADMLIGGAMNDTLDGGDGADTLVGGAARDVITGGAGNDDIAIQLVSDISGLTEQVDGGADYDRLDFATYGAGGAVDLTQATLTSVEELDLAGDTVTLTAAQLSGFSAVLGSFATDKLILSAPGTADMTGAAFSLIDELHGSVGNDVIILAKATGAPFVDADAGADSITGSNAGDSIWGGDGSDTVVGGAGNDTIRGGQDADNLQGGVGYDVFQIQQISDISGLAETINGGGDVDTLDFNTLGAFGPVDLTTVTLQNLETLLLDANDVTMTAAEFGAFSTISGTFGVERLILSAPGSVDLTGATLNLIDEIRGTSGADSFTLAGVVSGQTINTLAGADSVIGSDGGDSISGGADADTLSGGLGNDTLIGGAAADSLTGGDGFDVFRFLDSTDSTVAAHDVITDFTHGKDVIDLSAVDANSEQAGDQAFTFIGGAAFSHVAGELRYDAGKGQILGDINGDGTADFRIDLTGHPGVIAADFVL